MKNTLALIAIFAVILLFPQKRNVEFLDSALNTKGWRKDFNKADTTIIRNKIFAQ